MESIMEAREDLERQLQGYLPELKVLDEGNE